MRFVQHVLAGRSAVRLAAALAVSVGVLGVTACEPPPPPDGRDLGIILDAPLPATVAPGTAISVTGTLTNHGSVAAVGVRFTYAVTGGFVVDAISVGAGATCAPVSARQITCTIAEPLEPAASRSFTLDATAGALSGAQTQLVAVSSSGTEPAGDVNPNVVTFATQVRPPAADPVSLSIGGTGNHLGTGPLLGVTGVPGLVNEGLYLSVNPYCTDKVNGDRYQSANFGGTCSGTANTEYRSSGYTYAIDVPEGRTSGLVVRLWDPQYNQSCLGILIWSGWGKAGGATGYDTYSPPLTQEGPGLRYWDGSVWIELGTGESATAAYWQTAQQSTCQGPDPAIDSHFQAGTEPFTFALYSADDTPLDDTDNPLLCSQTFASDTPFDGYSFLGSVRWNTLCSISPSAPAGRYLLRVRNGGVATAPEADGSNQFGVVATYIADGLDPAAAVCDGRSDPLCPTVSGRGEASVYVNTPYSITQLALGRVAADQEGRQLTIQLFDPGEGGRSIRILAPSGPEGWAPVSFTWSSNVLSGTGTALDVTNSKFNGRVVTITVDLAGYVPPSGNDLWKVGYEFSSGTVTDRTTWTASTTDVPAS